MACERTIDANTFMNIVMENYHKRLCKDCFTKLCVNNLHYRPCILFQMAMYYVCNCFFDSVLIFSGRKEPPTRCSDRCFKIPGNKVLLYRIGLATYITSVCYNCALYILKVRFYRCWDTTDHILRTVTTHWNVLGWFVLDFWTNFLRMMETIFYCRICVLIVVYQYYMFYALT